MKKEKAKKEKAKAAAAAAEAARDAWNPAPAQRYGSGFDPS